MRDLEQHAPEVMRDERGDGREQCAERLDEPFGLLVVGEVGRAQRRAHVAIEQPDGRLRDVARRLVVFVREREQVGEREALLEQAQALLHDGDVGGGVARFAVVHARDEEVLARYGLEQRARDAGALGELGEGEELFGSLGVGSGDRGRQGRVGGVEVAVEDAADERERESPAAEVPRTRVSRSRWSGPYQATRPDRSGGGSRRRFW